MRHLLGRGLPCPPHPAHPRQALPPDQIWRMLLDQKPRTRPCHRKSLPQAGAGEERGTDGLAGTEAA